MNNKENVKNNKHYKLLLIILSVIILILLAAMIIFGVQVSNNTNKNLTKTYNLALFQPTTQCSVTLTINGDTENAYTTTGDLNNISVKEGDVIVVVSEWSRPNCAYFYTTTDPHYNDPTNILIEDETTASFELTIPQITDTSIKGVVLSLGPVLV